jgi:hypothetical protein
MKRRGNASSGREPLNELFPTFLTLGLLGVLWFPIQRGFADVQVTDKVAVTVVL